MTSPSATTSFTTPSDREIVMERVFNAPRALVFRVTNDPELLPQWWGPARLTTNVVQWDLRPGGAWRVVQRDAGGNEYGFRGVYREIVPPERVVRTFEFEGVPGHVAVETATFEDLGGRTRLRVTSLFESVEDRDGMLQGGAESGATESWERLATLLRTAQANGAPAESSEETTTSDREILLTRVFDAPRTLVFQAWTEPAHLAQWYGPQGFTTTTHAIDVRPGGAWRFTMHGPDGVDFDNLIVYLEIAPPERLVYQHGSADDPVQFETTVTFAEEDGRTRLTMRGVFRSVAERDQAVRDFHAVEGGRQTLERLAEFLAESEVAR